MYASSGVDKNVSAMYEYSQEIAVRIILIYISLHLILQTHPAQQVSFYWAGQQVK